MTHVVMKCANTFVGEYIKFILNVNWNCEADKGRTLNYHGVDVLI